MSLSFLKICSQIIAHAVGMVIIFLSLIQDAKHAAYYYNFYLTLHLNLWLHQERTS